MNKARVLNSKNIDNIKEILDKSDLVILADYRGLTVSETSKLRKQLKAEKAQMTVFKNTLMRIAFKDIAHSGEMLKGPSALINVQGDPTKVAKIVTQFVEEKEKLTIKGGVLYKNFISKTTIEQLAKLPGREELIATVIGLIKSPLSKLVLCLSNPIRNFTYAVNALKDKRQEAK